MKRIRIQKNWKKGRSSLSKRGPFLRKPKDTGKPEKGYRY